ncbi:unnamed protein product [Vitrella brassicaformis CCMP3155]|uniref:Uncharacterized protein n=1 Tax=Vitrella brassicaformis (strain CCMP3155) TaxID=1169540 RepID=A0A0G4GKU9_VITBC|nr:unnamed protein product [Vitrella brassicaformis CCMP3155]|eukprot:CEM30659.1 unnamed protein product [Vitrella brassicaformis CCMP3155]
MQSLSEEGSPSSPENQRRPHIPPIKRKERKNDKGKDKLSKGKMSDLFGKAKDAGVDGDKVTTSFAAKGAMEVEAAATPSRIQEWVELNKLDIEKQTAVAYHAIRSHSAIVFEERFFHRMWIGAYQWGVEQPIKDYATVVILDERLKGHELWEGKEAFCRWFAVLLDNKSVAYLKTDWGLSTGEKLVFHTDAYVVDFKNEVFHADWDPLSAAYYRTIKDSISFFKSQHNITNKTQLTLASEYLA